MLDAVLTSFFCEILAQKGLGSIAKMKALNRPFQSAGLPFYFINLTWWNQAHTCPHPASGCPHPASGCPHPASNRQSFFGAFIFWNLALRPSLLHNKRIESNCHFWPDSVLVLRCNVCLIKCYRLTGVFILSRIVNEV